MKQQTNCLVCPRIVVYEYVISAVPFVSDICVKRKQFCDLLVSE